MTQPRVSRSRSLLPAPFMALFAGALLVAVAACDLSALDVPTPTPPPASVGPTPPPSFVRPTPTPLPTFLVYVVRTGDTLSSIATEFGTSAESLAYWNRAAYPSLDPESSRYDPDTIKLGWSLVLIPFADVDPEALPPRAGAPSPSLPSPDPSAAPSA